MVRKIKNRTTADELQASSTTDTASGYDDTDRCRACGEHLADPHAPGCPADTNLTEEAGPCSA